MRMNAIWNCKNPHQGDMPRILCVCSAGLLRSPTIAWVLSNRGMNTRSAGVYDYALIQVDNTLIEWADGIVCADKEHMEILQTKWDLKNKSIISLDLPDIYMYRDPELVKLIESKYGEDPSSNS